MKKVLGLLLILGLMFITSCKDKNDDNKGGEENPPVKCTEHVDNDRNGKCDRCGEDVEVLPIYYEVKFVDADHKTVHTLQVEEGEDVIFPEIEAPVGYYYEANYRKDDALCIDSDRELSVKLREHNKTIDFYLDDDLYDSYSTKYSKNPSPTVDDPEIESYEWKLTNSFFDKDNNEFYERYDCVYKVKEFYNLTLIDGKDTLDLEPKTHSIYESTKLPTLTKDGYIFLGWFVSDISLTNYEEVPENLKSDLTFYARWTETRCHNPIKLSSDAAAHITSITLTSMDWNPMYAIGMPSGLKFGNLTDYTWTTSDAKIAEISQWGSISIRGSGYCYVKGVCTADKSYFIDGIIKCGYDGVTIATEEEANTFVLVDVTFEKADGSVLYQTTIRKGDSVEVLPTPEAVEGKVFVGWDHDNFNILTDTTFKPLYSSTANNPYMGKTISFVGDSLTSFWGWIPKTYQSTLNAPYSDVNDVNQTWWMRFTNGVGAHMFINDSYGGTCCGGGTEPTCNLSRLSKLVVNGMYADVTVLFIGSNDCAAHEKESSKSMYTLEFFEKSYRTMIDNLKTICPDTEIVLVLLETSNMYSKESKDAYNNIIKTIGKEYNLTVIDDSNVDLTVTTGGVHYIIDTGHPNNKGNEIMGKAILKAVLGE